MSGASIRTRKWGGGTDWCVNKTFPAGGCVGAVRPPPGSGAEPRKQTHFGKNLLKMNLKSGLMSVARQCMLPETVKNVLVSECSTSIWTRDVTCLLRHLRSITGVTNRVYRESSLYLPRGIVYVPSGRRATPRIFPEPLPFRHDYGCVGLRDKGSISVVHVMLMTLYCVAPEVRLLKIN